MSTELLGLPAFAVAVVAPAQHWSVWPLTTADLGIMIYTRSVATWSQIPSEVCAEGQHLNVSEIHVVPASVVVASAAPWDYVEDSVTTDA